MRKDMQGRWPRERYMAAQEKLFAIMRDKEAMPGKPILRHELKEEAQKVIGDTGLINSLLKYMKNTIMTNGQWFKCRYNSERVMEFWLEDADQKMLPEEEDGGILKEMLKAKVETSQTECTVEQTNLSVIKMLSCNILDQVEKLEKEMESNHRADNKQLEDNKKVTEGLERVQEEMKSLLKSIDKSTVTAMKEVAASPEESFTEALIAGSSTQNSNDKEDTTEGVELSS